MMECEVTVKKWGNSLGIILPKKWAEKGRISPEDKVKVVITSIDRKNAAGKLWGALSTWKASSDELERFVDKEFDIPV